MADDVVVRPLAGADLDEADRIFRVAFGTFLGAPEPEKFFGDSDSLRTRWRADPAGALAAYTGGRLAAPPCRAWPCTGPTTPGTTAATPT